ncbi:CocE/NonD family hydrolase [Pseudoduganella sp. DS3]|uniref:CocE/NonD family hydrolase n=1 Tax=Pseudoduganella guangdongensis TaxID=2692179 RepID=A0A6N9HLW7_9BURK|nr:CocE/NonD family hydrolase [Pseudoduganella guangdongensis]MYN04648.1 CocE/NonD family hydrolase [Pseudoduganella guangdongensis]
MRFSLILSSLLLAAQAGAQTSPMAPDIIAGFEAPQDEADYIKRVVMLPMRDGVKLYTVIVVPKGVRSAPIILTRTPYNAAGRARRNVSPSMQASLPQGDDAFGRDFIRVFQDVRGKYGSEGDYVMTRPVRGPLNTSQTDHGTDAWDTIEWLVKNVPETNGKVGMIGSSYEGFTVLMALTEPHPALKAAVPMSAMVDGWRGDDWFHNGAFRVNTLDYIGNQTTVRGRGEPLATGVYDDYEAVLRGGSVADLARKYGLDQLNFTKKLFEHPAYDSFWQEQALDRILARRPLSVPTMHVVGQWDQEDIYGAYATYAALEKQDKDNKLNYLAVGPWRHSGVNYEGSSLGVLRFEGDTALQFRRDVMVPFLKQHLLDGAPAANTPPVLSYQTGSNQWQRFTQWPQSCAAGCPSAARPVYLQGGFKLSFAKPSGAAAFDEYVADPAKPVPFVPRPVRMEDENVWKPWLVHDQRFVSDRTDVLSYVSEPLKEPLVLTGAPVVRLLASTSGSDADWVVKVIDVYPDEVPSQPKLGGFQLPLSMDVLRGRYRDSFEKPSAIPSNKPVQYTFALPPVNHVIQPGHRVMIQIQSSWFPLYDRNPQSFVPNIFHAAPGDYRKATQRVFHGSSVELPVVK